MELTPIHEPEAALLLVGAAMVLAAEGARHRLSKLLLFSLGGLLMLLVPFAWLIRSGREQLVHQRTGPTGPAG